MPRVDDNGLESRVQSELLSEFPNEPWLNAPGTINDDRLLWVKDELRHVLTNHHLKGFGGSHEIDIAVIEGDYNPDERVFDNIVYKWAVECKNLNDNVKRSFAEKYVGRIIDLKIDKAFMVKGAGSGDYNWPGTYEAYGISLLNENNLKPLFTDLFEKKSSTYGKIKRLIEQRIISRRKGLTTPSDIVKDAVIEKSFYGTNKPLESLLEGYTAVSHINDLIVDKIKGDSVVVSAELAACNDNESLIGGCFKRLTTPVATALLGKAVISGWPYTRGLAVYSEANSNALRFIDKHSDFIQALEVSPEELEVIRRGRAGLITVFNLADYF